MPLWEEFRNSMLGFGLVAVSAGLPVGLLFLTVRSRRLWPLQRLRKVRWKGPEVWLAFMTVFFVPMFAVDTLDSLSFFQTTLFDKPPSPARMALWASPLTTLLTVAILFWLLFAASATRPSHVGMTLARWRQNIVLGTLAFLVVTPLVLGFYAVVQLLFRLALDSSPDTHALDKLAQEDLRAIEWVLLFAWATIAVPVVEELLFRGILQGWLRRATLVGHTVVIMLTLVAGLYAYLISLVPIPDQPAREPALGPLVFAAAMALSYGVAVYYVFAPALWGVVAHEGLPEKPSTLPDVDRIKQTGFSEVILPSPRPERVADELPGIRLQRHEWERKNAILAIFGSAIVFAAAHSWVWPSPIPLLLLGICLGALAYRTQSLLPSMVLHGLFNMVACVELLFRQTIP